MPKVSLKLSPEERTYLKELLNKGELKARQYKRATALQELDRGQTMSQISKTLNVSRSTLSRWSKRYSQEGLLMLQEKPRSGRPVEIDGEQRAKITALACSKPPEGYGRWTLRLLAKQAVELEYCEHLSHTQAGEILKKTS